MAPLSFFLPLSFRYQNTAGQSSCTDCPTGWYSHLPGSSVCVRCPDGRVETCTSCSATTVPDSSGDAAVTVGSAFATGFNGYSYPALLDTCTSGSGNTLFSFSVDGTCSMTIQALGVSTDYNGKQCSHPDNDAATVTAYYVDATTIMSAADGAATSTIVVLTQSGGTLTMDAVAASPDPASLPSAASAAVTVAGGSLAGTTNVATCPAGTYLENGSGATSCSACPVGSYCVADTTETTIADCSIGTANPLLGADASADCITCEAGR